MMQAWLQTLRPERPAVLQRLLLALAVTFGMLAQGEAIVSHAHASPYLAGVAADGHAADSLASLPDEPTLPLHATTECPLCHSPLHGGVILATESVQITIDYPDTLAWPSVPRDDDVRRLGTGGHPVRAPPVLA